MLKYCISDFFLLCLTMQKWLHFIAVVECPATHPFAYQNGSYCCQTNQEKINTAQGLYHWDSIWTAYCSVLCEAHKHVLWACSIMCLFIAVLCTYIWIEKNSCTSTRINILLQIFSTDSVWSFCNNCFASKSMATSILSILYIGALCDGGTLGLTSLCCAGDQFVPCPGGNCATQQGTNKMARFYNFLDLPYWTKLNIYSFFEQ